MTSTWGLALAAAAFVGTHLLMSHPLRPPLVARLGERGFLGVYSLVAAITFAWLIWARSTVSFQPLLWMGAPWLWDLATLVMLLASILLAGSLIGNPAMPNPDAQANRSAIPDPRGVFAITRHPMFWSFMLWAVVHAAVWGSPANLLVSGSIFLLSLVGALGQDRKKLGLQGARWRSWMDRTAFVPFAGQLSGKLSWSAAWPGWGALIGGALLFLIATWAHRPLDGPLVGIWRWLG